LSSEIIASKCLERIKKAGKRELITVSKENNFTAGLVQICFAKQCG